MNTGQTKMKCERHFMGHPGGLGILATGNFFNSFAWGGVYAILIYYFYSPYTKGLGFSQGEAASMIAAMGACNSMFTIVGSWLADRVLGAQRALIIGDIVKGIAFLLLAIPIYNVQQGRIVAITSLILMALPIMGASNSALTGQLYQQEEHAKRDSAFTIHVIANNIGGFIAPMTIGFIGMHSYHLGFFISSLFAFAYGAMIFLFGRRYFGDLGRRPQRPLDKRQRCKLLRYTFIGVVVIGAFVMISLQKQWLHVQDMLSMIAFVSFLIPLLFLWNIRRNPLLTRREKKRLKPFYKLFSMQVLVALSAVFVTTGLAVFIESKIDLHVFGTRLAPATFTSIFSFLCIGMSTFFVWFWSLKKFKNTEATKKYQCGMLIMSFAYMIISIPILTSEQVKFSCIWILVYYVFLAIAQNLIDPIGASLTASLAPISYEAQLQSAWLQSNSIANGVSILMFQYVKSANAQMKLFPLMAIVLLVGSCALACMRKKIDVVMNER